MTDATQQPPPPPPPPPAAGPDWTRRLLVAAAVVVGVILAALLAAAVVPRWWAQRIGDQADGSMLAGVGLGIFYGVVFTALPLAVVWFTFRRRRHWRRWLLGMVVAIVLALPNLMTLSIVVGTGSASHAGERILDVEGPGFRGATLVGAILGAVAVGVFAYQRTQRSRADRRASRLEGELRQERATREATPEGSGEG